MSSVESKLILQLLDEHCSHVNYCKCKVPTIFANLKIYLNYIVELSEASEREISYNKASHVTMLSAHLTAFSESHRQIINNAKLTFAFLYCVVNVHPSLKQSLASHSFFHNRMWPFEEINSYSYSQLVVELTLLKNTSTSLATKTSATKIMDGLQRYQSECNNVCRKVIAHCSALKNVIEKM